MAVCKPLPDVINGFKVITDLGRINKRRWAIVLCPLCNLTYKKRVDALLHSISCGCGFFTPNISRRLQRIHNAMMARCYRKAHVHYHNYGGRGIIVCDSWHQSKLFYKWAIENGYEEDLTIDRINNNKGYMPDNCRWVHVKYQSRNRRSNVVSVDIAKQIQNEHKRLPLKVLAEKYDINIHTLKGIKYKQNWKNL